MEFPLNDVEPAKLWVQPVHEDVDLGVLAGDRQPAGACPVSVVPADCTREELETAPSERHAQSQFDVFGATQRLVEAACLDKRRS